jgi:hypothetical protein
MKRHMPSKVCAAFLPFRGQIMATTPLQHFDLKSHLLSLYGLTPESKKMARFFDANSLVIAEQPVTAAECWNVTGAYWSNFLLADCKQARVLGAASVCYIPDPIGA